MSPSREPQPPRRVSPPEPLKTEPHTARVSPLPPEPPRPDRSSLPYSAQDTDSHSDSGSGGVGLLGGWSGDLSCGLKGLADNGHGAALRLLFALFAAAYVASAALAFMSGRRAGFRAGFREGRDARARASGAREGDRGKEAAHAPTPTKALQGKGSKGSKES
jgi:hypothetical protein